MMACHLWSSAPAPSAHTRVHVDHMNMMYWFAMVCVRVCVCGCSLAPHLPENAVDGKPDTEWKTSGAEDYWEIRFHSLVVVSSVELQWKVRRPLR